MASCGSREEPGRSYTFVLDQVLLSAPEYAVGPDGQPTTEIVALEGLDLDDNDGPVALPGGAFNPCNVPGNPDRDFVSPSGESGVDNNFGARVDELAPFVQGSSGGQLRAIVQQSISAGQLIVLISIDGVDSLVDDESVTARVYLGLQGGVSGTDGRLLAGQTFRQNSEVPVFEQEARIVDGTMDLTDVRTRLIGAVADVDFDMPVVTGRLRLNFHSEEVVSGVFGAGVRWQSVRDAIQMIAGLGALESQITAILRGTADILDAETGECSAMSATFRIHGVPAFILDEEAPEQDESPDGTTPDAGP